MRSIRDFANVLVIKDWQLYCTTAYKPFWIGDQPFVLHNNHEFGPYGNIGLAVPGIEIYLPLSTTVTVALWCPSIRNDFVSRLAAAKELQDVLCASIAIDPGNRQLVERLDQLTTQINQTENLVDSIVAKKPIICDAENATFLNCLQAQWANRYVLSPHSDFSMVRNILRDFPHYRRGVAIEMN